MVTSKLDLEKFERLADVLRALANERRLTFLCKLVEWGEANVKTLPGGGRAVAVRLVAAFR